MSEEESFSPNPITDDVTSGKGELRGTAMYLIKKYTGLTPNPFSPIPENLPEL